MRETIRVGALTIRFLVEGEESGGSVAVFEFDVPAGSKVAAAERERNLRLRRTGRPLRLAASDWPAPSPRAADLPALRPAEHERLIWIR